MTDDERFRAWWRDKTGGVSPTPAVPLIARSAWFAGRARLREEVRQIADRLAALPQLDALYEIGEGVAPIGKAMNASHVMELVEELKKL